LKACGAVQFAGLQITSSISLGGQLLRLVRYRFGDVEDNSSFLVRQ
jgi:hypothetical protein